MPTLSTPKIIQLTNVDFYLNQVINLSEKHKKTLGFFPKGAFEDKAREQSILVAVREKKVLGYLLFGRNRKDSLIYVVHLCVDVNHQGRGIAKLLMDELKKITRKNYRGIRVSCRRDYEINELWPKLGFIPLSEKDGKSIRKKTILVLWWHDFGHPHLFSQNFDQETKSKVAIDSNIVFDLKNPISKANEEAHLLSSEWLKPNIELCVTDEVLHEINRHQDAEKRKSSRGFIQRFKLIQCKEQDWQGVYGELKKLYPKKLSSRDASDIRHMAKLIGAGVNFFLSRDGKILKKSEEIRKRYGIEVLRPSDFVIFQDELLREAEYQPWRLGDAEIEMKRITAEDSQRVVDSFYHKQHEKKRELQNKIVPLIGKPRLYDARVMQDKDNNPLGLLISKASMPDSKLEICLFRTIKGQMSTTIAYGLLNQIIKQASEKKISVIVIKDSCLGKSKEQILQKSGFIQQGKSWVKFNLHAITLKKNLKVKLKELIKVYPEYQEALDMLIQLLEQTSLKNVPTLLDIEKMFWPLKIRDLDIPTFVVPVKPYWAMHLFDESRARDDLFGGDGELLFNSENVYYRSSKPSILQHPARILWYVSGGKGKEKLDTMCVKAASYLDEVIVDKPKILFSKFRRLGVYEWRDIFEVAKKNVSNSIMAFRFSCTEKLSVPIKIKELDSMSQILEGKRFNIQSPVAISKKFFFQIYEKERNQ